MYVLNSGFRPIEGEGFFTMTLKSLTQKIHSWRRYRQTVRELSLLSDHELADLGINRYDIESLARKSSQAARGS